MITSKDYEVLNVDKYETFSNVHVRCLADNTQHTLVVYPDYAEYEKLEKGNIVNGWIRRKGSYFNLVGYCKPERNWADNEEFL